MSKCSKHICNKLLPDDNHDLFKSDPPAVPVDLFQQPSLVRENAHSLWLELLDEKRVERQKYEEFITQRDYLESNELMTKVTENHIWTWMDKNVFPILILALKSTMFKAMKWDALTGRVSRFNGIDHLAELIWNFNPKNPDRYKEYLDIYDIPFVKMYLEEHPRPYFALSEIWTPNYAATRIQSYYRGYLVRKQDEVQEMIQFWRNLKADKLREMYMAEEQMPEFDVEMISDSQFTCLSDCGEEFEICPYRPKKK